MSKRKKPVMAADKQPSGPTLQATPLSMPGAALPLEDADALAAEARQASPSSALNNRLDASLSQATDDMEKATLPALDAAGQERVLVAESLLEHDASDSDFSIAQSHATPALRGSVDSVSDREIRGWIMIRDQPSYHCAVALRVEGQILARTIAWHFRTDLLEAGIGDGRYSYVLEIPTSLLDGTEHLLELIEPDAGFSITNEPIRWCSRPETGTTASASTDSAPKRTASSSARDVDAIVERRGDKHESNEVSVAEPDLGAPSFSLGLKDRVMAIDRGGQPEEIHATHGKRTAIKFSVDSIHQGRISGWACCNGNFAVPCVVDISIDGVHCVRAHADLFRPDVMSAGLGNGICGFDLALPSQALSSAKKLHLVISHPTGHSAEWQSSIPESATNKISIWIDFSDLLHYLMDNRLPTGIQRVQIELARAALSAESKLFDLRAVFFHEERRFWCELSLKSVVALADAAGDITGVVATTWADTLVTFKEATAKARSPDFRCDDILLNIGSSWWIADYMIYVRYLQENHGVWYVPFVHDVIPLVTPQYCSAGLVAEFDRWFRDVLVTAPLYLVNSECTGRDVRRFSEIFGLGSATTATVRLDAGPEPDRFFSTGALISGAELALARLSIVQPYVLFVGTLEIRKNHLAVFECWKRLLNQFGSDRVPMLVCVGKKGWLIEYTLNWLDVNPELRRHVRILSGISDFDLARLYKSAQFTIYSSFYEGWGLPVTESLCAGKVPLIPEHSSLPEAGGKFAIYYGNDSKPTLEDVVTSILNDPEILIAAEAKIATEFRPRRWTDVLQDIMSTIAGHQPRLRATVRRRNAMALRRGIPHTLGTMQSRPDGDLLWPAKGDGLRCGFGWWPAERWGCWTRDPGGRLAFSWPPGVGKGAYLYLILHCAPFDNDVLISGTYIETVSVALAAHARRLVRVSVISTPNDGAICEVEIASKISSLTQITGGADRRDVGIGVEALCLCGREDVAGRLDMRDIVEFGVW